MNPLKAFIFLVLSSAATAATPSTRPATQPVTQPTAANLQLHECAVFVLDASTGQLNPDGIITATLPAFVTDHRYGSASAPPPVEPQQNNGFNNFMVFNGQMIRMGGGVAVQKSADVTPATPLDDPSPVGIIRLIGSADSKVDVSITARGGTFAGSWPKAEDRPNQLLWRDLSLSDQPAETLSPVGPENWFTKLRSVESAFVTLAHTPSEKFLLYDLQMAFPSPLKVKAGKDFSFDLSNAGTAPLRDLTLYQGDGHQGWRTVEVGDLLAAVPAPAPAVHAATMPSTQATTRAAGDGNKLSPATKPIATADAATPPAEASFKLTQSSSTQPTDMTAAWKSKMTRAGVDPADAEMMRRVIARYAFDPHRLTAIYRMDDAEYDRLLPLEVVPQPAKISRFGLVIIINADPSAGNIVDDLIKQLGDDDWSKRDAAYHALAAMGPAATEKLKSASKDKDLEIAWRAERLLALNPTAAK